MYGPAHRAPLEHHQRWRHARGAPWTIPRPGRLGRGAADQDRLDLRIVSIVWLVHVDQVGPVFRHHLPEGGLLLWLRTPAKREIESVLVGQTVWSNVNASSECVVFTTQQLQQQGMPARLQDIEVKYK